MFRKSNKIAALLVAVTAGASIATTANASDKSETNNVTVENAVAHSDEAVDVTATTSAAVTISKIGWSQLADGTWNFYDATGRMITNKWVKYGGTWYYLNGDGTVATGWLKYNGTFYYLKLSGAMQTGWINDNGTWYYCNSEGAMLYNTTVDGCTLGSSGAWIG